MPAVLDGHPCTSCRSRHLLCSPDTNMVESGVVYEYECPVTRMTVWFATDRWSWFDVITPAGMIVVRRVPQRSDP